MGANKPKKKKAKKKKAKKPKKKKSKTSIAAGKKLAAKMKAAGKGIFKPKTCSPALAAITGKKTMPTSAIVKAVCGLHQEEQAQQQARHHPGRRAGQGDWRQDDHVQDEQGTLQAREVSAHTRVRVAVGVAGASAFRRLARSTDRATWHGGAALLKRILPRELRPARGARLLHLSEVSYLHGLNGVAFIRDHCDPPRSRGIRGCLRIHGVQPSRR